MFPDALLMEDVILVSGMGEKPEKPNRNPKESPKKFKVAKEGETAMGEAENMVDMVDKKRRPKEIMADIHMGCKVYTLLKNFFLGCCCISYY